MMSRTSHNSRTGIDVGGSIEALASELGNSTNGSETSENNRKRKEISSGQDNDSMSEDDGEDDDESKLDDSGLPHGKKKHGGEKVVKKKQIKNAREKERSSRIAKQIDELRDILTGSGVVVSKGTKSSVLTEAAQFIRILQQQQLRSEIDRNLLIQQIHMIGGGTHGAEAAAAIRLAAAQNGVWSLGNFDGVPTKSSVTAYQSPCDSTSESDSSSILKVDTADYKCIFNSSRVGMAIASMGGAFMDNNNLFSQLSGYSKQELCSLTVFNLTARNDLQRSFDLISRMISPPIDGGDAAPKRIVLRGSMKFRNDLGMSIALVKGERDIAKCFCITLVMNPSSPFDSSKPVPVSYDSVIPEPTCVKTKDTESLGQNPTFTSG